MVRVATPTRSSYVRAWEIMLCALLLPLPLIIGTTIGALSSATTPAASISQEPSYLGALIGFAVAFLLLQLVVMVALAVGEYRRQRAYWSMPIPMSIVVDQVIAGLSAIVMPTPTQARGPEFTHSLS
jgi:hypothetical protein